MLGGGKYGSNNGFDLVLQHPDGSVTIIAEGKQMRDGAFQLSRTKDDFVQLSQRWVDLVMEKLPKNASARIAIQNAKESGKLATVVGGVNRQTGQIILTPVKVPPLKITPPIPDVRAP